MLVRPPRFRISDSATDVTATRPSSASSGVREVHSPAQSAAVAINCILHVFWTGDAIDRDLDFAVGGARYRQRAHAAQPLSERLPHFEESYIGVTHLAGTPCQYPIAHDRSLGCHLERHSMIADPPQQQNCRAGYRRDPAKG